MYSKVLFLLFAIFQLSNASLNWISVAKLKNVNLNVNRTLVDHNLICERLVGWSRLQKNFCKQHYDFMETVQKAARLTLSECQYQFKSRRWNCSTASLPNLFARLPESGMRESSYLYALSSAALTYSITSACSDGRLAGCSCDETKQGITADGYRWSGCSDNIAYGMGVAENFLDPRVKNRVNLMLVNLHNFETGRQVIESNMVKQCKCHGVSGSCEVKTCWRAMPSFNTIANKLKEKYDAATQVEIKKQRIKNKIIAKNQAYRKIVKSDLIYLNQSPDYCRPNLKLAAFGTKDRVCNRTSRGIDSCDLLCCGRGYKTEIQTIKYKCNCTFTWCCTVSCKECQSVQEVTTCR